MLDFKQPLHIDIAEDPDDGGYVVTVRELPACITEGDTVDEAIANARDAIRVCLLEMVDRGELKIPQPNNVVISATSTATTNFKFVLA